MFPLIFIFFVKADRSPPCVQSNRFILKLEMEAQYKDFVQSKIYVLHLRIVCCVRLYQYLKHSLEVDPKIFIIVAIFFVSWESKKCKKPIF